VKNTNQWNKVKKLYILKRNKMICRLCLNALDEQSAVLLFDGAGGASAPAPDDEDDGKAMPESYLVQLISIHLYLCVSIR